MEDLEKFELAKTTLLKFFHEMNEWNLYACNYINKNGFNIQTKEILIEKLKKIFDKFCSEKLYKDISANCSEISGYDVKYLLIDKYEIITKNKIQFFITELNKSKNTYKYTMVYKNTLWLVDQKQVYRSFNDKWEKSYI